MSSDQDFRDLSRLLALKKHEQPPPGYFDRLPGQIISQLRAESELSLEHPGWLQRFWAALESKPIAASAFGAAVCGLLLGGVLFTEPAGGGMSDIPQSPLNMGLQASSAQPYVATANASGPAEAFVHLVGTNQTFGPGNGASLFQDLQKARSYQIDFSIRNP